MIVKVVPRDTHSLVQASYFDAHDAVIETGTFWFMEAPDQKRDYSTIRDAAYRYVLDVDGPPTKVGHDMEQWAVRFSYWYDRAAESDYLVVTAGHIYLMTERGETIDKVR